VTVEYETHSLSAGIFHPARDAGAGVELLADIRSWMQECLAEAAC
jgi:hypothetical protein